MQLFKFTFFNINKIDLLKICGIFWFHINRVLHIYIENFIKRIGEAKNIYFTSNNIRNVV